MAHMMAMRFRVCVITKSADTLHHHRQCSDSALTGRVLWNVDEQGGTLGHPLSKLTTSMPLMTRPNTVCLLSNQGVGTVDSS